MGGEDFIAFYTGLNEEEKKKLMQDILGIKARSGEGNAQRMLSLKEVMLLSEKESKEFEKGMKANDIEVYNHIFEKVNLISQLNKPFSRGLENA